MEIVRSDPSDRLSNLPSSVSETILTFMPLRDAVRTSILSKKWRHVWAKLPQFVLDDAFWDKVAVDHSTKTTVMKILFQLLLCHDGPIIKFTLSNYHLESFPEMDSLIFFLAKSHIEDFTLDMWRGFYLLPYSIFSCKKLRHLRLRSCSIRDLSSIGFSRLTSLRLVEVNICADTLASLISGSPLLALLGFESSYEDYICIDAPNLKTIILRGSIQSINFVRVPVLSLVSFTCDPIFEFFCLESGFAKFFDCLHALRTLQLSYQFLHAIEVQKTLPASLIHLVHLELSNISFNETYEISFTLCLLRSSPNLQYLEISIFDNIGSKSDAASTYMEGEDYSDISLHELRDVKLCLITGTKPELEFIRLLLASSSNLKKIQIQPKDNVYESRILREVIKFKRISREAEIIYDE